jgi:hypothetical protein
LEAFGYAAQREVSIRAATNDLSDHSPTETPSGDILT